MKRTSLWFLCVLLLLMFVTLLPAAAQDKGPCPQMGGTFTIGVSDLLSTLDPDAAFSDWTWYIISVMNSQLFRIESGQPVPDLAESWDISDDGKVYTWHLRKGMMWQDGNEVFPEGKSREVVADDVVYSIMRQYNDQSSTMSTDLRNIFVSVKAPDKYTVVLTLSAPDAIMYDKARGLTFTAIVAKEAVEKWGNDYGLHPIGSGPFEFVSFSPGDEVVLQKNEDYYIQPCLDKVIFKALPDVPAAMIALEAGDIDWWGAVTPGDYVARYQNNEKMTVINFGCPVETRTTMTVDKPPFDDVRFRHALAVMRDGDAINKALRGATHVHGGGTAGPGVAGYVEDLYDTHYKYDPELAKQLLDEMGIIDKDGDGWRDFNGKTLVIPLFGAGDTPIPDYVAAVVDAGTKVGLKIDPQISDWGTVGSKRQAGEFGLYLDQGWCGEGGTNSLWGKNGYAYPWGYRDDEIFNLLDKAAVNMNEEERIKQLQAATRRIADLYWAPSFSFFNIFTVKNNYVKDFYGGEWTLNIVTDDHNVWIAEDERP